MEWWRWWSISSFDLYTFSSSVEIWPESLLKKRGGDRNIINILLMIIPRFFEK